jgi:hypothetical protein
MAIGIKTIAMSDIGKPWKLAVPLRLKMAKAANHSVQIKIMNRPNAPATISSMPATFGIQVFSIFPP